MTTAVATRSVAPWADWDAKMRFADHLVKTGFLPSAIKTASQALAIIVAGQELGIPPMHALRSIHIIQGKPSMSAELMLALFKQRGGKAVWKHSDEKGAQLWLRHPNGDEHTEAFTLEDAQRAGLVGKDGWKNYPKAMLRARCASAGLRAVAPDIIAGIYDPEELGADVVDGEVVLAGAIPTLTLTEDPDAASHTFPPTAPASAPFDEWREAFTTPTTETALQALWKGCTQPALWETFSAPQQVELTAAKNLAKKRLGLA